MHRHVVHNSKGDHFIIEYDADIVISQDYATVLDVLDSRGIEYTIEVAK